MTVKIAVIAFLFAFVLKVFGDFNLTIVHISDFHSNWHEIDENKHDCSKQDSKAGKCYGGFARLLTFVREIRKKEKNVLILSSGEFFLGRSLYALHGWKLAQALLPKLELDAMSLSNHDFDSGILQLSSFLYTMKFPVLCANMVARNTSFLHSRVNKSVVLDVNGTKVGIVGYIHRHALKKSNNAVSFKFVPEIPALQEEVSRLENEGVDKIIALGHAGYFTDLEIAKNVKGVDIVMGGDSDIILFDPGHDADELQKVGNIHGNYPRVHHQVPEAENESSLVNRTLVLHIPQHGVYVGVLRATFDDDGKIIHESGVPVLLDNSVPQDYATLEFMEWATGAFQEENEYRRLPHEAEILGVTENHLDGNRRRCRMQECSLGNFIADAMLDEFTFHYRNNSENPSDVEKWGPIDGLVFNSGLILKSIKPGHIMIRDIVKALYLGGFFRRAYMSGQQVLAMMEHSVKHYDPSGVTAPGAFLQIAGLKVEYDLSQSPGRRVRSLKIRCRDCGDDNMYHPIVYYKTYVIGMPGFMYNGRDGFYDFEDFEGKDFGQFDVELIVGHLRRVYEVVPKLDGRIKFYQSKSQSNSYFAPPLLFGEPASEYNKLNGEFVVPVKEQSFETDHKEEENNLSTNNETVEINIYKDHENKYFSSTEEERFEQVGNSYPSFGSESSIKKFNVSGENKINIDDSTQVSPNFKKMDLKEKENTLQIGKNDTDRLNHPDGNRYDTSSLKILNISEENKINNDDSIQVLLNLKKVGLKEKEDTLQIDKNDNDYLNYRNTNRYNVATEMLNRESDETKSRNHAHLSEISSNRLDESKEIGQTYHDSSLQGIKSFKNNGKHIDKASKNENIAISLPKEHSKAKTFLDLIINNETKILNSSKFIDVEKILLNSTPDTLKSSSEIIVKKNPEFPKSSDLLKKNSHNLRKRSIQDWLNDSESMKHFYEFTDVTKILLNSTTDTFKSSLETIVKKFPEYPGCSNLLKNNWSNLTKRFTEDWLNDTEIMTHFYEFKNNISNCIENLYKFLKSNLSINSISSISNEIQEASSSNIIEKTFTELVKYILKEDVLNNLLKNLNGIMKAMNTTTSTI